MALVQKNAGTANGSASLVTSLGSATTAGNTILIFANGAGTITTPSGFVSRSPQVNYQGLYLFEKLVASGNSSDTPTLTMSGPYNATWQIVEYSGITAFDVSSGNNSNYAGIFSWNTPSITPTTGARLLVAFIAASNNSNSGTFSAGDPQLWINSFTSQQSTTRTGTTGSGRDSMVGGWADRSGVTGNGSTTYSTGADITSSTGVYAPASIIASYKVSAGGNAYTLTAATGSFAIAGQAATLRGARKLVAAVGAIALVGIAAGLKHGYTVGAAPGSFAISGQTASLRTDRKLVSASGSFSTSGKAATLRFGHVLTAQQGSFSLSGVTANLSIGRKIGAASGAFALSGQNAILRYARLPLAAVVGSYAISGQAAALRLGHGLAASTGAFTLSGQNAGLKQGHAIVAGAGAIALTGIAATLTYTPVGASYTISAATGSFVLSGQSSILRYAHKAVAQTIAFNVTRQPAVLRFGHNLQAAQGSFALSGQSAVFKRALKLTSNVGSYALTGNDAALNYSGVVAYVLVADTASYLISGTPADVVYTPRVPFTNPLGKLKMYTGSLGSVSNREDWIVSINLIGDDGTQFDLTGAEIVTYVCKPGCPNSPLLSGSIDDGVITLSDNYTMQWFFDDATMKNLCPAQYDVFCRVTLDDITTQLLSASIAVVDGGPQ